MKPQAEPAERGHGWTLLIRYATPCLIYIAAAPFGAWIAASAWLASVMAVLMARRWAEKKGRDNTRAALEGLLGLAYALAALDLLETGNTAAEVLATTMLGVGLFATLIRDYRDSGRLMLHVAPYVSVILIMQAVSIRAALQHHRIDLAGTIIAAPLLVGNVFMILHRELVAAHRRLASAVADAEAVARSKADFLANMSHEIRTPLNAVLGYASLLERSRELGEDDRAHVRAIGIGGADLLAIVNDVLDSSRLEAGKLTLNPESTWTLGFLRDSVQLLQPLASDKSIDLQLVMSSGLPERLIVDAGRLRQVLSNLIGNALKITTSGAVTVHAFYTHERGELAIDVEDTGTGIGADDLPHLFERFTQADVPKGHRAAGSGLGLSISKELMELMGGDLTATSIIGSGSTFHVRVPAPFSKTLNDAVAGVEAEPRASRSARVLVVDDHAANRKLIRLTLDGYGHQVSEAADGLEAVALARAAAYDLILMDLNMPGMDGYATAAEIRRAGGANAATPIVAVSANVMPEQLQRCRASGLDDHLTKPISPAALLGAVAKWRASRSTAAYMRAEDVVRSREASP